MLEQYLQHYVNQDMDNWVELLPLAKLSLSTRHHYEKKVQNTGSPSSRALRKVAWLKQVRKDPQLKEGDKVYLLAKNLRSRRPSKKLDHVKVGPFLVDRQRAMTEGQRRVSYRLRLPLDAKVHPVFHVLLLEPADPVTPLQTTFHFKADEGGEYELEKVVGARDDKFEVKWKGYPESENTLEPLGNLVRCEERFRDYLRSGLHGHPEKALRELHRLQREQGVRQDGQPLFGGRRAGRACAVIKRDGPSRRHSARGQERYSGECRTGRRSCPARPGLRR